MDRDKARVHSTTNCTANSLSACCVQGPHPRCAKERPKYRTSAYLITPVHCQVSKILSNCSSFLLKGFCSKFKTEMWEKKKHFQQNSFSNIFLVCQNFSKCEGGKTLSRGQIGFPIWRGVCGGNGERKVRENKP